ncbi:hypothetical protein BCR44DRAFT_122724 [Catenaria anguillulae PL171]|uniref:Amidohydrolase-related domain-containing protein n=1 Tax=Catenaria anguillulae PL171 TaxID=765915 RepID=A0A1Y2I3Z6_9FUNG|nr:hypothetical protein BCR44DRAFT_122724 [Catenaria anguillulae PL171]
MEAPFITKRPRYPGTHAGYAYPSDKLGPATSDSDDLLYSAKPHKSRQSTRRVAITSALVATAVTTAVLLGISLTTPLASLVHRSPSPASSAAALSGNGALLSDAELDFGISQCVARDPPDTLDFAPANERVNQRDASNGQAVLIRGATVWNGHGDVLPNTDVLLVNGLIHAVGPKLELPPGHPAEGKVKEIDARGRIVTPGIVDMHSHAGVNSYPALGALSDGNEFGDPNLPMMRTIDAFHPHDKALPLILSGGVTTILVLPGSANLQGGEAFAFKTPQKPTNSAEDMLVFANLSSTNPDDRYANGGPMWRWAKQACGENPKRAYGGLGKIPFTRMGNAFKLRENYARAKALKDKQDEWCRVSESIGLYKPGPEADKKKKKKKHDDKEPKLKGVVHPKGRYPTDLALEQVVGLLRGQVKLNWHCYEVNDLETQMRIAREFNVSISAFHHALDIAQVTPALKRWSNQGRTPIGAAIFSDHGWYKKEAYQMSVYTPQLLEQANVSFAFKSDHPVLHSQYLVHESARSIQYGLAEQSVLKALTLTPAKLLGLDYRVGSIDVGKDADVVIWPANPFTVGSLPDVVIVDGAVAFEKSAKDATPLVPQPMTPVPPRVPITVDPKKDELYFKNIGKIVTGDTTVKGPTEIRVRAGKIVCIGTEACSKVAGTRGHGVAQEFDLHGATVTPSLVLAGTVLGLQEIAQEPSTQAGVAKTAGAAFPLVYTRDGLLAGGLPEQAAANQGVGLAVSVTQVKGSPSLAVSTLFATNHTLPHVVSEVAAVHTVVGDAGKSEGGLSGSYPGQIATLRKWLTEELPKSSGDGDSQDVAVTRGVRTGAVPLVAHAQSANFISALLNLKRSVDKANVQRWVIAGAAESHLNVDDLASFNGTVGVLLSPARCIPKEWVTRRCLSPPNAYRGAIHAAELFKRYNVPFALSTEPDELASARNLRFEAGWVRRFAGFSEQEMVASVTSSVVQLVLPKTVADEYTGTVEKQLQVGGVARFSAWNGDFGELKTQLLFAVDGESEKVVNYPVHI